MEVYKRGHRAPNTAVTLTIRKQGDFGVSVGSVALLRSHVSDDPTGRVFVVLCFDRERQCIGLKPVNKNHEDAYPVREYPGSVASLSALGFLSFFEIEYAERSRRLKGEWDTENEMLSFDLREAMEASSE